MRYSILSFWLFILAVVTGCSSPDSRISSRQAAFDQYPAAVQQAIRAGKVELGFTPEMVLMALGEPARKLNRRTDAGDREVWSFDEQRSRFSIGIGVGSGGGHSRVGGGVGVSTGGDYPDERMRVEFANGVVSLIDSLKK